MSTISILMCVYRKDDDLAFIDALDSLIPNKKDISETIIVINGPISNNKMKKIDELIKILNIKKIQLSKNIGLAKALNIGLKKINSEWVVRFDSDDICLSNRLDNIKNIIKNNSKYDVIGTYIEEFGKNNKITFIRKVPLSYENIKKNLLFSNPINHVSVFFKRKLFTYSNDENFYPLIDGFEDYALWVKLLSYGKKFKNIPLVTVLVRADESMLIRRGGIKYILNEIRFRLFVFKYIPLNKYFLNLIYGLLRIIVFASPIFLKNHLYRYKRKYF